MEDRSFKVRVHHHIGQSKEVRGWVPQGNILSPILSNIFVRDILPPLDDCFRVTYADDVMQIVTTSWRNKHWMAQLTVQENENMNSYERQWKILTNRATFKMIYLAQFTPNDLMVEGQL